MTSKTASVFAVFGLYGIENCRGETFGARASWARTDSTATIVVVVMATLTRVNSMRRGLREASRSPSSNGTGR